MELKIAFNFWDWLLIVVVALFGTISSFVKDPQIKAVYATVPVPFSLAWLAVGLPVNVNNAAGVLLVLVYVHVVRVAYQMGIPIIFAIAIGIAFYVSGGVLMVKTLPQSEWLFVFLLIFAFVLGVVLLKTQKMHLGSQYRTNLNPIVKFASLFSVVFVLALIKKSLLGFTPFFPMMNSITSYEARHSLWVQCRQIPVFMVAVPWMLASMRYLELYVTSNRFMVLSVGVLLYMIVFLPTNKWLRKQVDRAV